MLVKLKKEYLAVWLKRLASVDLGATMHDIYKSVFIRLDGNMLTLIRTGNNRSFAIIRTDEIVEIEDAEEPLDALVHSGKLCSIINKFSDGTLSFGIPTNYDFYVEQNGFKGNWKQKCGKEGFPVEKALSFRK